MNDKISPPPSQCLGYLVGIKMVKRTTHNSFAKQDKRNARPSPFENIVLFITFLISNFIYFEGI